MSWWDTRQLANFATQALKTAQKRIDKVLDIKEEEIESTETTRTLSLASAKLSSDIPSETSAQSENFFESWLGDEALSNDFLSSSFKQPVQTESENILKTENSEWTTTFPSTNSRQKSPEQRKGSAGDLTRLLTTAAAVLESEADGGAVADEDALRKSETKVHSHFTTSYVSAFDEVRQSKSAGEDAEPAKDRSGKHLQRINSDTGISAAGKEDVLTETAKHSEVVKRLSDEEVDGSSFSMKQTSLSKQPKAGLEDKIIQASSSMETSVEETKARDVREKEVNIAAGDLVEDESLVQVDDGGWADVNLSVLNQDETRDLCDSIFTKDDETPCVTEAAASAVIGTQESAEVGDNLRPEVAVDPLIDDTEHLDEDPAQTDEADLGSKDDLSSAMQDCAVSLTVNTNDGDEIDKKDAIKSVSSSMLSSCSEIEGGLKEGISLEGSLAASDELSESNKTLTGDDLDPTRDDTDVEETKQEFSLGEDLEKAKLPAFRSGDSEECEIVTSDMVTDEPENQMEHPTDTGLNETTVDGADTRFVEQNEGGLSELSVNMDSSEKVDPGKSSDSPRSVQSGSSYVRNLLEEAMAESNTDNSHESEVIRESEYTSGHTSADEIDTTTSSDIEIISHISTPNSNFHPLVIDTKHYDVSPSKARAWSRSVRSVSPRGHKRSDSGSSAQSLQSRNGEDLVSPEFAMHRAVGEDQSPVDDHSCRGQSHSRRNPSFDVQRLQTARSCNADAASNPYDTEKLLKKLAEMAMILDAREKKQLELSQDNIDLMETNTILKNQLKQLEEAREAEMEDVKEVSDEFTRRIAESEKKLQMALREKEALKKAAQDLEVGKRSENVMNEKLLKEKEQIIAELLEEGEKLSKQQLQSNNVIKKLRGKEKDNETTIRSQKLKIDDQKEEIERLEGILEVKVDAEKKNVDTINQLNLAMKSQEEEISRLKSDLEDAVEKARSLKVALDNSYKEISELHKARVTDVTQAQKVAINTEMQVKEQLKQKLEEHQHQSKQQQTALVTQVEDLQLSLCRMEKEHGRREDILRQEISDLQQRLQEAEERNQELTQSVSAATRPLLRQIENLQTTYSVQSSSYERVEKNLTDRLAEAQSQLAIASEKERLVSDRLMESTARLTSLESQVSTLRQERVQLQSQLDLERAKVELAQETKNNESKQRDTNIHKLQLEVSELKKDKVLLENQLEMERMKVETKKKKVPTATLR